jgi:hypothetical protein
VRSVLRATPLRHLKGLARHTDPKTSKWAAEEVDLSYRPDILDAVAVLVAAEDGATHQQIGTYLIEQGFYPPGEKGRRAGRTLSDRGLLTLKLTANGEVEVRRNPDGGPARVWVLS